MMIFSQKILGGVLSYLNVGIFKQLLHILCHSGWSHALWIRTTKVTIHKSEKRSKKIVTDEHQF